MMLLSLIVLFDVAEAADGVEASAAIHFGPHPLFDDSIYVLAIKMKINLSST